MTPALDCLRIFAHSFFVIWCPAAAEEGGEGGPEQVDVECGGRAGAQDEAGQPQGSRETHSVVCSLLLDYFDSSSHAATYNHLKYVFFSQGLQ